MTSQTEIFLRLFRNRVVGITGTKGKSTTSSLIYAIIKASGQKVFLLGNIGIPPLDLAGRIDEVTMIIFEMSSHQLDEIQISPRYSVFLNLFEEHLDHYSDIHKYRNAKYNIFKFHEQDDWLIYNCDDKQLIRDITQAEFSFHKMGFSSVDQDICGAHCTSDGLIRFNGTGCTSTFDFRNRKAIPGRHNLMNIMAAICIAKLFNVGDEVIRDIVNDFPGLEHRLQYIGKFKNIHFYNDSIATIPEATIEAINTLGEVATLILGGKDRGINYGGLVDFLTNSKVKNIILIGEVGIKLISMLVKEQSQGYKLFHVDTFSEIAEIIRENTPDEGICLLSPAASSYGMFKNFEERGRAFKRIAENL
jgi:UDP-N-acetylmuramoylalanine--D-glutamate ligase